MHPKKIAQTLVSQWEFSFKHGFKVVKVHALIQTVILFPALNHIF